MEVLCEDIVDESKEPTVPDVYVDKDEMDMNEDYMADWTEYNQWWNFLYFPRHHFVLKTSWMKMQLM